MNPLRNNRFPFGRLLKIALASIYIVVAAGCDKEEEEVEKRSLVFPDVVVRTFDCAPNCGKNDASREFDNSLDKWRITALISRAKKEIVLGQFMFFDSDVIINKLFAAAIRGVTIRIYAERANLEDKVPDSISQLVASDKFKNSSIEERVALLKKDRKYSDLNKMYALAKVLNNSGNNNLVKFNEDFPKFTFHLKYALIDDEYLVAYSGNWSFSGLGYSYEIFAYYRKESSPSKVNPFICATKLLFEDAKRLHECNTDEVIFIVPKDDSRTLKFVKSVFSSARKRIWVAGNQYGTELFSKSIQAAKNNSVDFRILTGSNVCANHKRLPRYHAAGATIKCVRVNYCYYQQFHNKYFIVDDALYFGSLNLDYDGFFTFWDFLIRDDQFLGKIEKHFTSHWDKADKFEDVDCKGDGECLKKHCAVEGNAEEGNK